MKITISLLVMSFFVLGAANAAAAEDGVKHRYVGWLEGDFLTVQEPEGAGQQGWIVIGNDGFAPAEFCPSTSEFICFFSRGFAFGVPRRINPAATDWTIREVKFELLKRGLAVSLLGRQLEDLMLIKAPPEATMVGRATGKSGFFLYSRSEGLVGFGLDPLPDGAAVTYWIQGQTGFGASERQAASLPPAP